MRDTINITAAYDSWAGVWSVERSSLSGIDAEGYTLKEFRVKVREQAQRLLDTEDVLSIVIHVPDRYGQFR